MQITKAMILAAGYGKRMLPLTKKTPKPLIKIGPKNLLERSIELLIKIGVKEIVLNIYYLSEEIEKFIKNKNYEISIKLIKEKELLDTGGGIFNATKQFNDEPFFVLNPDTVWNKNYYEELKILENFYFMTKKPVSIVNDTLAVKALRIMNEKKITSLCVHKKNNILKTIGLIHIHHLLDSNIE